MKKIMLRFFISISILFLSACASMILPKEKPKLKVESVDIQSISFTKAKLLVHCTVDNPNTDDIELDRVDYKIFINNMEVGQGVKTDELLIKAKSSSKMSIPVNLSLDKIYSSLDTILQNRKLDYKLVGTAKIGIFSINFEKEDELKIKN